jgi:RNA polymerase subunit RPABC4/transcription elongation factor Spt4
MLLNCPECGGQVSDKAQACPSCGYPVAEILNQGRISLYDPETMIGKTPEDEASIQVAMDFYGELLVSGDGRVWNNGGQVVAEYRKK